MHQDNCHRALHVFLGDGDAISHLRRLLPACRAVAIELVVQPVPGSEVPAYPWLDIVDFAESLSICRSFEERAPPHLFPGSILPVIDTGDAGEIVKRNFCSADPSPVRETDGDMLQDVAPVRVDPWNEIIRLSFLVPPPSLAAPATLEAVLFRPLHDWDLSSHTGMIFFFVTVVSGTLSTLGNTVTFPFYAYLKGLFCGVYPGILLVSPGKCPEEKPVDNYHDCVHFHFAIFSPFSRS